MKPTSIFIGAMILAAALPEISGCGGGGSGPAPVALSSPPLPTPTPAARTLYVDHDGTLYVYRLPLSAASKPLRSLVEAPGSALAPQIAVNAYGTIAITTPTTLSIFHPPIVSFAPSHAKLILPLTPAITEIGQSGAVLADTEYDPNGNLWLLSNLGADVTELQAPITNSSVAALSIGFGAPGSKTAGFTTLVQARFDVNATLYVYAASSSRALLFKTSFPYAKPPSPTGLDLDNADFVDSSQYLPTNPNPESLILGQYNGALKSPPPGSPPPPPVNRLAQFAVPLNPVQGLFPNATVNTIAGALVADPPRDVFYVLNALDGRLSEFNLPLSPGAAPKLSLACPAGSKCNVLGAEHMFMAP
ncbi:MAG: hypothetical protein JOY69_10725 [Candidatus Eremiobacteraeota bacterium]|nr:hypothetical protein [Candidatus Eremiobacteraeota bacterium]